MEITTLNVLFWYDGPQIFTFESSSKTHLGFLSSAEHESRVIMMAFEVDHEEMRNLLQGRMSVGDIIDRHDGTIYYNDPSHSVSDGERFIARHISEMPEDDRSILTLSGPDIALLIGETEFCQRYLG